LFVILSNYDKGWNILDNALQKKTNTTLSKVLNVFEGMLCFDAWLNLPGYWSEANEDESKESVRRSIQNLMKNCKTRIPSPNSANWKKPKFHELLEIIMFICRFGAPSNYSAERPESLLIPAAKQPGRRSQKRHATYVHQAARRLASSYTMILLLDPIYIVGGTLDCYWWSILSCSNQLVCYFNNEVWLFHCCHPFGFDTTEIKFEMQRMSRSALADNALTPSRFPSLWSVSKGCIDPVRMGIISFRRASSANSVAFCFSSSFLCFLVCRLLHTTSSLVSLLCPYLL
jgi:hypothetical protein